MNNLFSTATGREELNSKKSYLPIGIHSDCVVSGVEVVKADNWSYLQVMFLQPASNSVAEKRIFFPDASSVKPRDGESKDEAVKRDITNKLAHVTMITDAVLDEKQREFSANSFEEFVNAAVARIKQFGTKTPVAIKLVPNSKGYASFPNYADGVERMVEGKHRLTFSKKEVEAIQALTQAKPSKTISSDTEDDNLPF